RRLAEEDGACGAELRRDEGVGPRERSRERERSGGGRHVARVDVVLQDHRNALQRTRVVTLSVVVALIVVVTLPILAWIAAARILDRVIVHVNIRIEMSGRGLAIVGGDAVQIHPDQLLRGDDVRAQRVLNGRYRRFEQVEARTFAASGHGYRE